MAAWTYVFSDLNGEKIAGNFMKNCKRQIRQSLELKK